MVATNLKSETMKLMDKEIALAEEENVIIQRLCQLVNLVSEGFPRSEIDIPTIRSDRHGIAELRNDKKEITEKINLTIQLLHSAKFPTTIASVEDSGASTGTSSSLSNSVAINTSSAVDVDFNFSMPFAIVDEITELSPAAEGGLQVGDQILKFGNVEKGENLLQRLAAEVQQKQR